MQFGKNEINVTKILFFKLRASKKCINYFLVNLMNYLFFDFVKMFINFFL
jgi:hypothetical protein